MEIRSRFANKNKNRCDDWFTVFYKLFDWLKSVLSFWKILEVLNLKFQTLSSSMSAHLQIFARISTSVASEKVKHVSFPYFQITKCKFTWKQIQGMGLFKYSWWLWRTGLSDTCLLSIKLFYSKVVPHRGEDSNPYITIFYTFILKWIVKYVWGNYV